MSQKEYDKSSDSEKKKEDWMNSKWRPMMGWMYMMVCMFDFVIAPVLWSIVQAVYKGGVNVQWQPLTLQGAGLFHLAMGAIIGVSSYGRTQEKMNGANNGGLQLPSGGGTTYTPPAPIQPTAPTSGGFSGGGFGSPSPAAAPSFGSSAGFGAPAAPAAASFGGGFGAAPTAIATTASGKKIVPDLEQPLL
jgi:Holin of 3TMs, for gene-transfer release